MSGLVTLELKYKLVTFNFGGARHHLVFGAQAEHTRKELKRTLSMRISSLRACSVHASVPYTYAQHGLKALFKVENFTLMLSIRVRNWCACSACASVPDAYAQRTDQFLTRMLRVRINHLCVCSACFEGTALLKIRLSIRVRNFAAPNELLNIFVNFFYFNPKVALPQRLYGVKIMKIWAIENLTLGHRGSARYRQKWCLRNMYS